jgi:hypothetical protein
MSKLRLIAVGSAALITVWACVIASFVATYVYGVVAGFKVAWWVGILCLFPPFGFFEGLIKFFGGPDLAARFYRAVMS